MSGYSKRLVDINHIARIKQLPCISCGAHPPTEAAHVRIHAGMGMRPDDNLVLPLCDVCHRTGPGAEHNVGGSKKFYSELGIDPVALAAELYDETDLSKMRVIAFKTIYGELL